jgi:hypothetical protein
MRWSAGTLACFALATSGCLHQVAQLVGDGGLPNPGSSDGGDGGVAQQDDAGTCTYDSQCASGDYCDITVTWCRLDAGPSALAILNLGTCLHDCGTDCPAVCHVDEDCPLLELCVPVDGGVTSGPCTREQPCSSGKCFQVPCAGFYDCPIGCFYIELPHGGCQGCICPGNTCTVPAVCAVDGTPCDGGVCVDGGCSYGCWIDGGFVPPDNPLADGGRCDACYPWISTRGDTYLPEGSACLFAPGWEGICYYKDRGPLTNPCTCTTAAGFDCPYFVYDGDAGWELPCCEGKCSAVTGKCCQTTGTFGCPSDDWCCDNGRCLPGPDGFGHCSWDAGVDSGS